MKKISVLSLICFLTLGISHAQGWELSFGGGGDDNRGFDIIQTQDSTFVVVSRINCDFSSNCQAAISKISQEGELIWTELIFPDTNTFVNSVIEDSNGDLVITGRVPLAQGGQHLYVNKMNSSGELIWSRLIGDLPEITWIGGEKILLAENNTYQILGRVQNSTQVKDAVLLAKYDQIGNEIWREIYWFEKSAAPIDIVLDSEENIWVVGNLFDFQVQDVNYLILKVNEQGELLFDRDLGELDMNKFSRDMAILDDNSIYFFAARTNEDELIVEINSNGQIEFEISIGQTQTDFDRIIKSEDNQIYLLTVQDLEDRLLKLDEFGEIIWNKLVPEPDFETTFRTLTNFKQTSDEGFIACGYSIHMNISSVYIIRLDKNGNLVNTINLDQVLNNRIKTYPNPSNGFVTIEIPEFANELVMEVFDPSGRLILSKAMIAKQITIDIRSFTNGLYFYKIRKGNEQRASGRFIKME